jgi:hypothetical protein
MRCDSPTAAAADAPGPSSEKDRCTSAESSWSTDIAWYAAFANRLLGKGMRITLSATEMIQTLLGHDAGSHRHRQDSQ